MAEALRLAQRVIDLADGDPTIGNLILGSPLAFAIALRGAARWCLGLPGLAGRLRRRPSRWRVRSTRRPTPR